MPDVPIPVTALAQFAPPVELRTERLLLRPWRDSDLPAWTAMNADPEVRRYFGDVLSEAQALGEAERVRKVFDQRGWGWWALEVPGEFDFAGFVGVTWRENPPMPWTPAFEAGWRLRRESWGKGYATESAQAALQFAFERLAAPEVVAITAPSNAPSRKVMERIGMAYDQDGDFDHPSVAAGSPLRRHVLYRISRQNWEARA